MDDLLYCEEILERYHDAPYHGRLEAPDLSAELDNPLCGDHIRLELALSPEDQIGAVRFDGHGCVISQVSASLLAEHLEGFTLDQARGVSSQEALGLLGIPLTPARLKCGLLAWRILQRALPTPAASREREAGPEVGQAVQPGRVPSHPDRAGGPGQYEYDPGKEGLRVGQAFQPDVQAPSGWKA